MRTAEGELSDFGVHLNYLSVLVKCGLGFSRPTEEAWTLHF